MGEPKDQPPIPAADTRKRVVNDLKDDLRAKGFPEQVLDRLDQIMGSDLPQPPESGIAFPADQPTSGVSEIQEGEPNKDRGAIAELKDAHKLFKQAEGTVVEQILGISRDARSTIADLESKLPFDEERSQRSGRASGTDGREITVSIMMFSGKGEAITFQDPNDPDLKTTISPDRNRIGIDQHGEYRSSILVGIADAFDEGANRHTAWPTPIFGGVLLDEDYGGSRRWSNADPLDIARRGLDFLKSATLKPAEQGGQMPPAAPSTPPPTPTV